jgi:hypothetical protein
MSEPVECRSDGDYAGRPLAIYWQGERRVVDRVLATWRTPEGKVYRVDTLDGRVFDCWYVEAEDTWTITEV